MNGLLSIIIVNYKVADILQDCMRSISDQNADTEVIVVDNDSGDHDRDILNSLRHNFSFLTTLFNERNEGFSKANNQGFAISRGNFILFLNPDTFLFPECLPRLLSFIRSTRNAACVIPKLWLDKNKTFLMPPSDLPSFWNTALIRLSLTKARLFRLYQRKWLNRAQTFWDSRIPLAVDAISGSFFMTSRRVLERVGIFDERFPLYFEDSDFCRRIGKAGLRLYYYPDAEAVHYYNQSAKSSAESVRKFAISQRLYMEKYYHPYLLKVISWLESLPADGVKSPPHALEFSNTVRTSGMDYLLFSIFPTMIPCVAHKVAGERFTFNRSFVADLPEGRYYALLLRPDGTVAEEFAIEKKQEDSFSGDMERKPLTIRLYKPGDEMGIVKLFKEIFGREMTLEEWRWKYTGQGNKKVYSSIAVNETNEVIAHYGGIPHRMIYHGKEIYGLSIGDVMVHPKFRSFKVFKKMAALVPDEAAIDGFILGYGFPNERALQLPEKLGLYEKIEDVFEADKEVEFHKNIIRFLYKFFPMTYDDRRINKLWESVKDTFGLSVVRDREYLQWRYEKHPFFSYELWGLRKRWSRRLQGLAVLRNEEEKMLIIDFVVNDNLFSTLFQKIENYVFTLGKKKLTLWHPEYFTGKLNKLGFSINKTVTCIPRTTHEKGLKKEDLKGKFFYTMGDTDFL